LRLRAAFTPAGPSMAPTGFFMRGLLPRVHLARSCRGGVLSTSLSTRRL
jgi:hypothetical protein